MTNQIFPLVPVSVTVTETAGVYAVSYDPSPVTITEASQLSYTLDTDGWEFTEVNFSDPFSDLEMISATAFTITDNGGPQDSTNSFSMVILQTDPHKGQDPAQIDTDPEVVNGPHG